MKTRITSIIVFILLPPFASLMAQNSPIDFDGISKNQTSLNITTALSVTNSNTRSKAIVIHTADCFKEANMQAGRSWTAPP